MMTHVLTCAWIMLMPWNTPKQERNGATSQNFAEGARMETWTFHDISIPLALMSISRKSPRRTAMSHGSQSTSCKYSIVGYTIANQSEPRSVRFPLPDLSTAGRDELTWWLKAVGDVMCLNSSATTSMARFSRTDAATLSTKGLDACCLIQLLSWSLSWISAVSYGICKCICRIPCETISAAKMERAPASVSCATELIRIGGLKDSTMQFWNTSTMKDKMHMHYLVWPQDPNTTFLTSWRILIHILHHINSYYITYISQISAHHLFRMEAVDGLHPVPSRMSRWTWWLLTGSVQKKLRGWAKAAWSQPWHELWMPSGMW